VVATTTLLFIVRTFDGVDVVGDNPRADFCAALRTPEYRCSARDFAAPPGGRVKFSSMGRVSVSLGGAWLPKLFSSLNFRV
jgi:hypothetical protein